MSDILTVSDIRAKAYIGYKPRELKKKQLVLVSLQIAVPTIQHLAKKDPSDGMLSLSRISQTVIDIATARHRNLIETLAEDIAQGLLRTYPINEVRVELQKPGRRRSRSVGLIITRLKKSKRAAGKKRRD